MLSPPPMGESDSSDLDLDVRNPMPLGHTSVKSLSSKFNGKSNGNHENGSIVEEQKRMIENLRAQVNSKDRRIQQLEDQIRLLSLPSSNGLRNESMA